MNKLSQIEITDALSILKSGFQSIWNRGDPSEEDSDYLIEKSEYTTQEEYSDFIARIDTLKNSITEFENSSSLAQENTGGFEISFSPITGPQPLPIKEIILESEALVKTTLGKS